MKKFAVLSSVLVLFVLMGCNGKGSGSVESGFNPLNPNAKEHVDYAMDVAKELGGRINTEIEKNEAEEAKHKENFDNNQIKVSDAELNADGSYKLKIKSYGIEYSEFYKSDIITIKADFTNLFESNTSFLNFRGNITAYQDGIVLSEVFGDYDYETGTSIKPGKTIEVAFSYILRNTDSDLELEGLDMEQNPDTCSFKLK